MLTIDFENPFYFETDIQKMKSKKGSLPMEKCETCYAKQYA